MDKLYVIVRNDLRPGMQIAQACHAMRAFVEAHPEAERSWHDASNNLVVLQVPDEQHLVDLGAMLAAHGVPRVAFCEPDLEGAMTALAAGPSARRYVCRLPLALAETVHARAAA
jgi:peptidyl-tRNA hydrolase